MLILKNEAERIFFRLCKNIHLNEEKTNPDFSGAAGNNKQNQKNGRHQYTTQPLKQA